MFGNNCSAESISKMLFIKEVLELVMESDRNSAEGMSIIEMEIGTIGMNKVHEIIEDIKEFEECVDTRNS